MSAQEGRDDMSSEAHTYVTHLQFSARDDAHARKISARIVDLVTEWEARARWRTDSDEPRMLLAQGYAIEAENVTDADDWGEHIGAEDLCSQCWEPGGTNRLRVGSGSRMCAACVKAHRHGRYQIEDVAI
jgi:RNA polymerase-binding transcription factor DksA